MDLIRGWPYRAPSCHKRQLHLVSQVDETKGASTRSSLQVPTGVSEERSSPDYRAGSRGRRDDEAQSKQDLVSHLGARPVIADALDPGAVAEAVASAEPR